MEQQLKDDSWAQLRNQFTWGDCEEQYLSGLSHIEAYCKVTPSYRLTNAMAATMGGLHALYVGLRPILANPARFHDKADQSMADCILAMVRKIKREIPAVTPQEHIGHV